MKEKKSNIKENEMSVDDEQKLSLIRLIGLFLIVYSILCLTTAATTSNNTFGGIISSPFTFLLGSFSLIALIIVGFIGVYMLFFKKLFNFIKPIQYVLIVLAILFYLSVTTYTTATSNMTFGSCFKDYLDIYNINHAFFISGDGAIGKLGGGMIGYMVFGLINSMTNKNSNVTFIISLIIFIGVLFILFAPLFRKIIKFIIRNIKKMKARHKEKKALKEEKRKQKELNKKQQELQVETDELDAKNDDFDFNNNSNKDQEDDLLETTEINIFGDDYSYQKSSNNVKEKLETILEPFDEELYSNEMKHNNISSNNKHENFQTDFVNKFDEDFSTVTITNLNLNNDEKEDNNVIISNDEETEVKVVDESIKLTDFNNKEIVEQVNIVTNQEKDINQNNKVENENVNNISSGYVETKPIVNNNQQTNKKEDVIEETKIEPAIDFNLIDYELPPLYLLKEAVDNGVNSQNEEVAKEKAEILLEKMRELNVSASINAFVVGPSVTRFEISLAPGVRVNTFTNLQDDFKLALGVNSVRIESPIPGKSAIGVEVPNKYRAMVSMKEIITQMPNKKHKLYVPVGKDITGTPLSMAICDMPHCLISGATNSGKSVCANTIILSLLMNYKPSEVRMIMVDPKRVEMLFYKDIPHLLCPIITEADKASVALDKLCKEMDRRFTTFSQISVKNIASYNEVMVSQGKFKMPFIILIVDEFAELMLSKNQKVVEERIQKIAQLGRAAGIHLILATQRPDVNVIPGTIKTNLPCRMTFRLSSLADSRTVIDVGGAEKLLNNGDMLLLTPDFTGLRRVQGVYVSDKEISDVVEYCKKQASPQYDPEFLDLRTDEQKADDERLKFALEGKDNDADNDNDDEMYEEIKKFVIKERKASTSYLKRKFNIGYFRAAKMIDRLEEEGIIGPENGSKPREVLIGNDEDGESILDSSSDDDNE